MLNIKQPVKRPPSDLFEQKELIQEFANIIGIKQFAQTGIEADDLMYSLAREYSDQVMVIFVTSDKDMGQAINDNTQLFDPFKDKLFDRALFELEVGMPVEKLPFYYALLGDASDNIPGVSGVGKKTALDLVLQFDSLQDMYARIEEVKSPRIRQLLVDQRVNAELSLTLFLLQQVHIDVMLPDLLFDRQQWYNARSFFEELDFKSLLKDLGVSAAQSVHKLEEKIEFLKTRDFRLVTTHEQLHAMIQEMQAAGSFACDTETDGGAALDCALVGVSFSCDDNRAYYIPVGHNTNEQQLPLQEVIEAIKPLFADPKMKVYFHHAKFDQHVLHQYGIDVAHMAFDTLIAANLVAKDWQRSGLKYISVYYLNEQMISFDEVIKPKKLKNFSYVMLHDALYYAANDSRQTWRLVPILQEELKKERMQQLYDDIELPLTQVLVSMEQEGIHVNATILENLRGEVQKALDICEDTICGYAGVACGTINLNSPKQLAHLLFDQLGIEPVKKSAGGKAFSTDVEVLSQLAHEYPIAHALIKYRELSKLLNTYIDALPDYINKKTGKIHTTYNQIAVATGRLASADPNLQNIPAGDSLYASAVRSSFVPKSGHLFVAADYSQIELRVLAFLSQDERLLKAFKEGKDIHTHTAAGLFEVKPNEVTPAQRQLGKRINFSILYGMTPYGLSKDLNISYSDAKLYIDRFFAQYPKVQIWMDGVTAQAQEHGYVTTYWGRRRYIPNIHERNQVLFQEARRVAINTVGQGTAAEIMKKGMVVLAQVLKRDFPGAEILLQIHDELLISAPADHAIAVEAKVKEVLEHIVDWDVPLQVDTQVGKNWSEV